MPEATIVFGHMGAYFHGQDALAVAERCENVVLETSGCPYPELIGEAVRRVGAERVIFGSDGPGCPPAIELDKVRRAGSRARRPAQGAVRQPARADGPGRAMIVDALVYAGASLYGGGRTLAELLAEARGGRPRPPRRRARQAARLRPRRGQRAARRGVRGERRARPSASRASIPGSDDAAERLRGLLEHPAVRGLLLHPWEETFAANRERARRARGPGGGARATRSSSRPAIRSWPRRSRWPTSPASVDGTVVMTRGGQVNMAGLAQQSADLALAAAPNLRALSAGMYRQDWLERCVAQFGAERLLHGSCAPVFDLGYEARARAPRADGR